MPNVTFSLADDQPGVWQLGYRKRWYAQVVVRAFGSHDNWSRAIDVYARPPELVGEPKAAGKEVVGRFPHRVFSDVVWSLHAEIIWGQHRDTDHRLLNRLDHLLRRLSGLDAAVCRAEVIAGQVGQRDGKDSTVPDLTLKRMEGGLETGWCTRGNARDWRVAVRVSGVGPAPDSPTCAAVEVLYRYDRWRTGLVERLRITDAALCGIIEHMLRNPTDLAIARQGLDQLLDRIDELPGLIEQAERRAEPILQPAPRKQRVVDPPGGPR